MAIKDISSKNLKSLFKACPIGMTHYIDFRPGDYSIGTYAKHKELEYCLCKSQSEMDKIKILDFKPTVYSMDAIKEELKKRALSVACHG